MGEMRILVCGGRDFADRVLLFRTLNDIREEHGIACIVEGGATGADRLAYDYGRENLIRVEHFPADWKKYGKAAGPIRNQRMIDEGKPSIVLAFPGGRGTADMCRRAEASGIPVVRVLSDTGDR